ncbi:MAG: 30S ribosomal protein S8 [Candidatus Thioglobus sp.]|uniref:SSU ribosomal protein S8p (S15Ae) n=1 Tax=hydrothermal vent metagenome TaxID=652676 RepID=A0A1W1DL39_9ZZZZ|nr:MAG: 30S ribosomal protein S8 [Candidatus Thioglobus sp.]HAE72813.1 30S ribosomal protein S8 [Gammaproteobacteria bacterium]RUM77895.1 MAG: 30S ribosomal protein S8 [Candidatus Thioglobus sp.]RUM78805.1 MAG: 30S ribosomal protein S8 [Candidatus Thioglobus sp.]RUM81623.1 MAG: 30S ribosomal protein S8 [Candidatus Thioglobus sp.]
MSMSDPVADMLTRIRNAHMVDKKEVNIPASNLKSAIASVMQQEGYIESFSVDGEAAAKTLTIKLKYYDDKPVIDSLQRISKPSLRVYVKSTEMPSVMNGLGIVIVSTPKGVMTGQNAAAENVGGEVLCSIS